ncbi:hypothetical protein J7I98_33070 [Streptomyces sp. ISL-98]|uniref:NAD(P)-binding domain-containing protein n=1 Tax=Streptomyces sp. ISL-98 TaxID=2819192 RepID=UPI001BEADB0F|nr:NAD(P)-binding domain-containing protein [Streptomyces sp. ISL-98]MBT2510594.1 hypothetical protein [Streptomyces sp. ISL-98]
MFDHLDADIVIWCDGEREKVDAVILATGYRTELDYLAAGDALDSQGRPVHRGGVSTTVSGLG